MRAAVFGALLVAIQAARADVVVLESGDVLRGQVIQRGEQSVMIEHPLLGTLILPAAEVASVTIQPAEAPTAEADAEAESKDASAAADQAPASQSRDTAVVTPGAETQELDEPEKAGLLGTGFLQGWTREFELGIVGEAGVSDSLDVLARVSAEYEDDQKRWIFDGGLMYGQEDGVQTDGEFDALIRRDWRMSEQPIFYFGQGAYEFDNFENWDHRARGTGGAGYEFFDNETYELDGRLGAGVLGEFGGPQGDEIVPEGLVGVDFSWNVREGQVFTAFNTFYPQLEDVGEFRNVTGLEYTIEIDREDGLSFKFGIENEHDSTDVEKNDLMYYSTLIIGF